MTAFLVSSLAVLLSLILIFRVVALVACLVFGFVDSLPRARCVDLAVVLGGPPLRDAARARGRVELRLHVNLTGLDGLSPR